MAGRRRPASRLVVIKELLGLSTDATLSTLYQVQGSCFVNCVEIFHFGNALHVVSEYMTMSLLQIVAAPQYLNENQVAAIIGQVNFLHCWKKQHWR